MAATLSLLVILAGSVVPAYADKLITLAEDVLLPNGGIFLEPRLHHGALRRGELPEPSQVAGRQETFELLNEQGDVLGPPGERRRLEGLDARPNFLHLIEEHAHPSVIIPKLDRERLAHGR